MNFKVPKGKYVCFGLLDKQMVPQKISISPEAWECDPWLWTRCNFCVNQEFFFGSNAKEFFIYEDDFGVVQTRDTCGTTSVSIFLGQLAPCS